MHDLMLELTDDAIANRDSGKLKGELSEIDVLNDIYSWYFDGFSDAQIKQKIERVHKVSPSASTVDDVHQQILLLKWDSGCEARQEGEVG